MTKSRAGLLLWFLSVVKGYDEADALEYICDSDDDGGFDGLLLETHETAEGVRHVVTAFQSKYPERPSMIGDREVAEFIGRGNRLQHVRDLRLLVEPQPRRELQRLVQRFGLEEKIKAGTVAFRLSFVTAGFAGPEARKLVEATNRTTPNYMKIWDIDALGPAIEAYNSPTPIEATVAIPVRRDDMLVVGAADYRVAVAAVRAVDIITWPGIADRTLFNLNVRRQLPVNKVRNALDRATAQRGQHDRFLASHNGITVICKSLEMSDQEIVLQDPSVVNGAQSVIAFLDNRLTLTETLRVFVKICEIDPASPFARDIAIRSNTQSAVNSRNLRALDGPQLRLQQEFETKFPNLVYETRPDASLTQAVGVIHNHHAAKCLCAVMNRRPWLAVKSLSLFDEPNYAEIFDDEVHAEQVYFSVKLRQMIDEDRANYPEVYRRSWALTSIVGTYLAAEALRAIRSIRDLGSFARDYSRNPNGYQTYTETSCRAARKTLEWRRDQMQQSPQIDDFKVDFKNEQVLLKLGEKAREFAIVLKD